MFFLIFFRSCLNLISKLNHKIKIFLKIYIFVKNLE